MVIWCSGNGHGGMGRWPVQKGNNGILRCTGQVEMGSNGLVAT